MLLWIRTNLASSFHCTPVVAIHRSIFCQLIESRTHNTFINSKCVQKELFIHDNSIAIQFKSITDCKFSSIGSKYRSATDRNLRAVLNNKFSLPFKELPKCMKQFCSICWRNFSVTLQSATNFTSFLILHRTFVTPLTYSSPKFRCLYEVIFASSEAH